MDPATDARLVERTAWGSTLAEVCGQLLAERLAQASGSTRATLRAVAAGAVRSPAHLRAGAWPVRGARGGHRELPGARAGNLSPGGLLAYGVGAASRRWPDAGACGEARGARRDESPQRGSVWRRKTPRPFMPRWSRFTTWRAAAARPLRTPAVFGRRSRWLPGQKQPIPGLRGLALVVLELEGRFQAGELAQRLGFWLSDQTDAAANARLIAASSRCTAGRSSGIAG